MVLESGCIELRNKRLVLMVFHQGIMICDVCRFPQHFLSVGIEGVFLFIRHLSSSAIKLARAASSRRKAYKCAGLPAANALSSAPVEALVQRRNPCPLGMVRKAVSLEKESAHSFSFGCCLHNKTKGKNNEQIQANVAYDMALRIPHRLNAKISVSGDAREGKRGSGIEHSRAESPTGVRGDRVKRSGGPRPRIGADTAENIDFPIHGAGQREGGFAGV